MDQTKATRNSILGFILILSVFLGACQTVFPTPKQGDLDGSPDSFTPDGALVIFWHGLTGIDEDRLVTMIDEFNTSNAWDITVVAEYQGDLDAIYTKIISGLSTAQRPNLVMTDPSLTAAYASRGIAVALAPYLVSETWGFTQAEREDFFPSAFTSNRLPQFNGQLYSFPSCRSLQVLYYNLDWLKELGQDAPPQTWEAFREMACAASQPLDGRYGFELGMDSSLFTSLLATQNVSLLNQRATLYTLGGEQGRAGLRFLQSLVTDGCALWEAEEGDLQFDFVSGKILFAVHTTAELNTYRRAIAEGANFNWSLSPLPHTSDEPLVGVEGNGLTILQSTPEQQLAAWLFIRWLAEPAQQARRSQQLACFPTRRSALEEMGTYVEEHPQYRLAAQLLEREWITEPSVVAYEACSAGIGRMLYAVTAGESADQWLTDTRELCNQTLQDASD